ncbi:hypothetical protein Taro_026719 [Colocasia esculenta]|uniref:Uncharacterized protein n=1 Tax=Colocasia esculenta TaxID=4460 RepID=A0A843VC49_COLES|nr:hypothetical protein [Colocasia esculenta]
MARHRGVRRRFSGNERLGGNLGVARDWSKTSMATSDMEVSEGPAGVNIPSDGQEGVATCDEEKEYSKEELEEAELMAYLWKKRANEK